MRRCVRACDATLMELCSSKECCVIEGMPCCIRPIPAAHQGEKYAHSMLGVPVLLKKKPTQACAPENGVGCEDAAANGCKFVILSELDVVLFGCPPCGCIERLWRLRGLRAVCNRRTCSGAVDNGHEDTIESKHRYRMCVCVPTKATANIPHNCTGPTSNGHQKQLYACAATCTTSRDVFFKCPAQATHVHT